MPLPLTAGRRPRSRTAVSEQQQFLLPQAPFRSQRPCSMPTRALGPLRRVQSRALTEWVFSLASARADWAAERLFSPSRPAETAASPAAEGTAPCVKFRFPAINIVAGPPQ